MSRFSAEAAQQIYGPRDVFYFPPMAIPAHISGCFIRINPGRVSKAAQGV